MSRLDRLQGVAHDIGHHAQSGLSYLYPHLGQACRQAGVRTVAIDLLDPAPYPAELPRHEPLAKALISLRMKLAELLRKHGRSLDELTLARLEMGFPPGFGDGSPYAVISTLEAKGRRFVHEFPLPPWPEWGPLGTAP